MLQYPISVCIFMTNVTTFALHSSTLPFQVPESCKPKVVCGSRHADQQTNTKMLHVKTKQETVWWFLLLGSILGLPVSHSVATDENLKTTFDRTDPDCEDYLSYLLVLSVPDSTVSLLLVVFMSSWTLCSLRIGQRLCILTPIFGQVRLRRS